MGRERGDVDRERGQTLVSDAAVLSGDLAVRKD